MQAWLRDHPLWFANRQIAVCTRLSTHPILHDMSLLGHRVFPPNRPTQRGIPVVRCTLQTTASCGWNVRCVGVRGDAWPVLLSPCNTCTSCVHRNKGNAASGVTRRKLQTPGNAEEHQKKTRNTCNQPNRPNRQTSQTKVPVVLADVGLSWQKTRIM